MDADRSLNEAKALRELENIQKKYDGENQDARSYKQKVGEEQRVEDKIS